MENLFLILVLIVGIVILAIPQSITKTIKKAMPVLLLLVAVFGIGFFVNTQTNSEIKIIASNDQDGKAEGNEIFLKEIIVNGESKKPVDIFSKGWIEKDGGLLWRSYDQIDGMKDSIRADFQSVDDVILVLKQNKWQGRARIVSVQGDQGFDGYADSESDNWMNFEVKMSSNSFLSRRNLIPIAVIIWIFLVGISLVCKRIFPEPKRDNKERFIGLDALKIISALMIILIHSSANIYNNHTIGSSVWFAGLILNVIPRFAVPTFLMISGALLLGRKTNTEKTIKRAAYAGIALVVWSICYIITKRIVWNDGDIFYDILTIPFKVGPSGHLWYGYLLMWIYLFLPVLQCFYDVLGDKLRLYFIIFALVIPSIIDGIMSYFTIDGVVLERPTFIYLNLGYIAIIFIGRMIYENKDRINAIVALGLSIIGFICTAILSVGLSQKIGSPTHTFFFETQISNVVYAVGIMALFCKINLKGDDDLIKRSIIKLSELSLGIYFSHSLLMWIMGENINIFGADLNIGNSAIECIIFVSITFIGIIIAIAPLGNIPFLKKLVKIS
jgi:hypothetical protein